MIRWRRLPVEILAEREIKALIHACSGRSPTGVRYRALLAVLYRSGVRISEALALEPRDLDARHGTLNIRHGKGDQQGLVGMDDDAFALLELWLERRRKLGLARADALRHAHAYELLAEGAQQASSSGASPERVAKARQPNAAHSS